MRLQPLREREPRWSLKSIMLIAVLGSLATAFIATSLLLWPLWASYQHANRVVAIDRRLSQVTVALARERGLLATALGSDEPAPATLLADVAAARQVAETGFAEMLPRLARSDASGALVDILDEVNGRIDRVDSLRREVDAAVRHSVTQRDAGLAPAWMAAATDLIEASQDLRLFSMRSTRASDMTFEDLQMLQHFAWSAAEHAGRERALLGTLIAAGDTIDDDRFQELQQNRGEAVFAWELAMLIADGPGGSPEMQRAARSTTALYFVEFERLRHDVIRAGRLGLAYPIDAAAWFAASTTAINSLLEVEQAASEAATRFRDDAFLRALVAIVGGNALFVILIGIAVAAILSFKRGVSDPLRQITVATQRFARGDYAALMPNVLLSREVAEIAAAVGEFRDEAAERARLETELRLARDQAEAASRAKTQFLANMSHELRTPLNAIIGFSELIKDQALGPVGHERYLEYAGDVHRSGSQLLGVINDVLDMAQIEAQQGTLQEQEFDLLEVAGLALRRIESPAKAAGLTVATDWAGPLRIRGDLAKTDRMIANLLSNAVKFTPSGGRIVVRAYRGAGGGAVLEVDDTGIGMSVSDIAVAYEPFHQVDGGLNRRHEGTGLGVPLSSAIAKLHGGRLEIDSDVGVGTTARIVLPASRCLD